MPTRDFPAPASARWLEGARAWLANPSEGPPVRGAATVMLLRDAAAGVEVYVLRRVASMEFAPSMYVFPGGGIDPLDTGAEIEADTVAPYAERMGMPPHQTAPILAAAIREVHEEVGVRLSVTDLEPRAHWITPPFEPRRYDTWFFAAAVPGGQEVCAQTSESDHARWVRPQELLGARDRGEAVMLPPTVVMLETLAGFATVNKALADSPALDLVAPELIETPGGYVMRANLP